MTATRSQVRSTSDRTCDDRKTVVPAVSLQFGHRFGKRLDHQWVEPARRLVEDGHFRARHQGRKDAELPLRPVGQVAQPPRQVGGTDVETTREAPDGVGVGRFGAELAQVREIGFAAQLRVDRGHLAREIADETPCAQVFSSAVETADRCGTAGGP